MSKKLWSEFKELAKQEFAVAGFRQRCQGFIYTTEINEETQGYLGLSKADGWGRLPTLDIGIGVGVRNHAIESTLVEIMNPIWSRRGFKSDNYTPSLTQGLNCLMPDEIGPQNAAKRWAFAEGADHLPTVRDMVSAVNTYGRPFMETHRSLIAMTQALMDGYRYNDIGRAAYRRPIAYYLLGDPGKALEILECEIERKNDFYRANPRVERDTEYFEFAAELTRRLHHP